MDAKIVYGKVVPLQPLGCRVSRRVLAYTEHLMIVEVVCEQGGVGSVHTHPHWQNTYIRKGRFRLTIDGAEHEVAEGDSIAFPPDIPHGMVCLEAGALLDIFTPMRKDFVPEN